MQNCWIVCSTSCSFQPSLNTIIFLPVPSSPPPPPGSYTRYLGYHTTLPSSSNRSLSPNSSEENEIFFTLSLLVQTFKWWEKRKWHQGKDVLIFRQILLASSIRNVWGTVRRICIFISGFKGSRDYSPVAESWLVWLFLDYTAHLLLKEKNELNVTKVGILV